MSCVLLKNWEDLFLNSCFLNKNYSEAAESLNEGGARSEDNQYLITSPRVSKAVDMGEAMLLRRRMVRINGLVKLVFPHFT